MTSLPLFSGALNVPNLLTLFRILLVPVFVNLILYDYPGYALGVFLAAGVTDALDGLIARLANQRTTLGQYLDPLADKLLLVSAFVVLSVRDGIPVWATIIVVSRDVILSLGALIVHLLREQVDVMPTWLGKITTVSQLVYVVGVMAGLVIPRTSILLYPLLVIMLFFTFVSGFHYIFRGIRMMSGESAS